MASFYKEENDKLIFTGDGELIYYVPEKYFDINIANQIGESINVMGIFSYGLFDKAGKKQKVDRFKCPTMIACKPSFVTKEPKYHLEGTKDVQAYRLFHFKKDDELICNTNIPMDIENVEKFMSLLIRANLPESIPYNELYDYIIKNAEYNGFNYKVSGQIIGVLISELCRDPKDLSRPFRLTSMNDMNDYKAISITKVPKYTSPYTSITSENADEAIAAAMTTKGTAESPLENIMMD